MAAAPRTVTFRFPHSTRLVVLAGLLFVAVMVGLAVYLVVRGDIWVGLIGGAIFARFGWRMWGEFSKIWFFSIALSDTDILARMDLSTRVAFPVSKVSQFVERRLTGDSGELSGYQFLLISAAGDTIAWSTQLAAWAELVDRLHRLVPHLVPVADSLEAPAVIGRVELGMWVESLSAPAHRGPDENRSPFRWWDAWLAYGGITLLLLPAVSWVGNGLKSIGMPGWIRTLLLVPPFVLFVQFAAQRLVSLLRRMRSTTHLS